MSQNRVELNDMMLEDVVGGTAYDPVTKSIGVDADHMCYHYKNLEDVKDWISKNVHSFNPATREQDIINGLLAADLID